MKLSQYPTSFMRFYHSFRTDYYHFARQWKKKQFLIDCILVILIWGISSFKNNNKKSLLFVLQATQLSQSVLVQWKLERNILKRDLCIHCSEMWIQRKLLFSWKRAVCSIENDQVRWRKLYVRMSRWLFANCRSFHPSSFVSSMPNLPTVPAQCWFASGPTLAFQSPWTKS